MFVTSSSSQCIYVYDSSGRQKTTIGSYGTGPLQFNSPCGIAINGDIMYVAENVGHRIHKLTLGGMFLGTFGSEGSGKGQFSFPWGIYIGPDGRLYVADTGNDHIQVFHHHDTFSHSIDCKESRDGVLKSPCSISFDFSGHLHVTGYSSKTVSVFTPEGQYIHQYGQSYLNGLCGIAIDSTCNSLVVNNKGKSLSIFNPHGNYIHSIGDFYNPVGVAVASNGSVWVADSTNNRLVKY